MSTFFLDLLRSSRTIGYSLLSDALGLSLRPLAIFYAASPWKPQALHTMIEGGPLPGILGTITALLIVLSVRSLLGTLDCPMECWARCTVMVYVIDGLAQLPILIVPAANDVWSYPVSRTGMLATTVQLRVGLPAALNIPECESCSMDKRGLLLSLAVPLRYMSLALIEPAGPSAVALQVASAVLVVFAVTPASLWELMGACLERAAALARDVLSSVYLALAYVWPRMQAAVVAVLQHPIMLGVYRMVILPMWLFLVPWFLPCALLAIACACGLSFMEGVERRQHPSADGVHSVLSRLFCMATACISALVLCLQAVARTCRREQPDPFRWPTLVSTLACLARVISFPWWLASKLWEPLCTYVLSPLLGCLVRVLGCLCSFATDMPLLLIPCVLLVNVLLLLYLKDVAAALSPLLRPLAAMAAQAVHDIQPAVESGRVTDSVMVLVFIMAVQIGAYHAVDRVLEAVRAVHAARGERPGHVLSLRELNDIAVAMDDPRQCARCGFGPVDHRGCSDLRSHHMEVSVQGGSWAAVSNACPRCSWFTGNLQDWPPWDGELQTERGRAMFRQRVWCEVVVVIRSSSKALLFPYGLLLLGQRLTLPPSLSAFLALSYLLPWAVENRSLAASINSPNAFRGTARRRHAGQGPQPGRGDEADCGAAEAAQMLPAVSRSEALANILAGTPASIFLAEGEACSVCLEHFSAEAVQAASAGESTAAACQALQALDPPVVALRCGHPLHVECAEAAVSAGGARHVRCPLCREPVTLSGDLAAAAFS